MYLVKCRWFVNCFRVSEYFSVSGYFCERWIGLVVFFLVIEGLRDGMVRG